MNGITCYFANIWDAIKTTAIGMKITLKYWFFVPPTTIQYPDRLKKGETKETIVQDRFRGFLQPVLSKCIGCNMCMRACPINCIKIELEKREDGRFITKFDIDQAKCMYCGLCVEECNSEALIFTKRFEGSCSDIESLWLKHVIEPTPVAKPQPKAKDAS